MSQTDQDRFFSRIWSTTPIPVAAMAVALRVEVEVPGLGGLQPLSIPYDYMATNCGLLPGGPGNDDAKRETLANGVGCDITLELKDAQYHKIYGNSPPDWKGVVNFEPWPASAPPPQVCTQASEVQREACWSWHGVERVVAVGEDLPMRNGNLGANINDSIIQRLTIDNGPTFPCNDGHTCGTIVIPVYDKYVPGLNTIKVLGFAAFQVDLDDLKKGKSTVTGRLVPLDVALPAPSEWPASGGGGETVTVNTLRLVPPTVALPDCPGGVCATFTPAPTNTPGPTATTTTVPTNTPTPPTATPPPPACDVVNNKGTKSCLNTPPGCVCQLP